MSADESPRTLRASAWLIALVTGATALFIAGALSSYPSGGLRFVGFLALSLLGCLAMVEVCTARVTLSRGSLEAGSVWSRRQYTPAQIEAVKWERGAGVALRLAAGGWVKLPDLGRNSQSVANTIRAWLNRSRLGGK